MFITFILFFLTTSLLAEENFILLNGKSGDIVCAIGAELDVRRTPSSTFKVALCLMGFDSGVLQNEANPVWEFKEGYVDYLESWRKAQTPQSWIKNSALWYSQVLAEQLGLEKIQAYLALFDYGNQDTFTWNSQPFWVSASLKISPREQVTFIKKLLERKLPINPDAMRMTCQLLFLEDLPNGWKLYGKTGLGSYVDAEGQSNQQGWFVGWIEKGEEYCPFAYTISAPQIEVNARIPRAKQLIADLY